MDSLSSQHTTNLTTVRAANDFDEPVSKKPRLGDHSVSVKIKKSEEWLGFQNLEVSNIELCIQKRISQYKLNACVDSIKSKNFVRYEGCVIPFRDMRPECNSFEHDHGAFSVTLDEETAYESMLATAPDFFRNLDVLKSELNNGADIYRALDYERTLSHPIKDSAAIIKVNEFIDEVTLRLETFRCDAEKNLSVGDRGTLRCLNEYVECYLSRFHIQLYDYSMPSLILNPVEWSRMLVLELLDESGTYFSNRCGHIIRVAREFVSTDRQERLCTISPLHAAFSYFAPDEELIKKLLAAGAKPHIDDCFTSNRGDIHEFSPSQASMLFDCLKLLYEYGGKLYDLKFHSTPFPVKFYKSILLLHAVIENLEARKLKIESIPDLYGTELAELCQNESERLDQKLRNRRECLKVLEAIHLWIFERTDIRKLHNPIFKNETYLHTILSFPYFDNVRSPVLFNDMLRMGCESEAEYNDGFTPVQWLKENEKRYNRFQVEPSTVDTLNGLVESHKRKVKSLKYLCTLAVRNQGYLQQSEGGFVKGLVDPSGNLDRKLKSLIEDDEILPEFEGFLRRPDTLLDVSD